MLQRRSQTQVECPRQRRNRTRWRASPCSRDVESLAAPRRRRRWLNRHQGVAATRQQPAMVNGRQPSWPATRLRSTAAEAGATSLWQGPRVASSPGAGAAPRPRPPRRPSPTRRRRRRAAQQRPCFAASYGSYFFGGTSSCQHAQCGSQALAGVCYRTMTRPPATLGRQRTANARFTIESTLPRFLRTLAHSAVLSLTRAHPHNEDARVFAAHSGPDRLAAKGCTSYARDPHKRTGYACASSGFAC